MQTLLPALYNTGKQANLDDYLERLELLLPDAAHLITRNPQEFALAYAERYQSDVLSLEQAWTFLTAAQMQAWQREEDEIVVRLTSALAYPAGRRVHLAEVEQVLQRGIEASRRSADTQHLAAFLNRLGGLMVAQGQYDHGQQLWYNGLQLAESARVLPILWEPLASFVHSADILGNYSAARQLLELVRNTNRSKHAESLTAALFIRGFFARVNKNLDEAAEDFSACLRLLLTSSSDKTPLSPTQQLFSMVAQAELARTQGNYAHSQDCTEKALTLAQIYGDHYTLGTLLIDQIIFTCRQDHLDDMCRAVLRLRELSRFVGTPHFQERSRFFDEYLCACAMPVSTAPTLPAVPRTPTSPHEPLSAREREVLQLVAAGLANHEIADQLVITPATVKKHLEHIYVKLNTHNRTSAIARARALQIIS